MSDEAIKTELVYTTVAEFSKTFNVPSSTLYYMLNKEFVKLRMVKTKYGKRKKFSEEEMKVALAEKLLL